MTPIKINNPTSPPTIPPIAAPDNPPFSFELDGLEFVEPITQISLGITERIPAPGGPFDIPGGWFVPEATSESEMVGVGPESWGL